jgi:hypothetical protein
LIGGIKMTYEEAKAYKQQLDEKSKIDSDLLNSFEKNSMGMTPDHIRETTEWKKAKQSSEKSFSELKNFNSWFMKNFKKEYAADRRKNRFKKAN